MPKASRIASELRRLADALDTDPDAVHPSFVISLYYNMFDEEKINRLALAMPDPCTEMLDGDYAEVRWMEPWESPVAIRMRIPILQKIVKPAVPAVYAYEPILSPNS